ncbi:uncharacterized protein LACBIDRAFT_297494 [Laccaria bicolor S238N-H82]|uniref:Predicted protein n=1 Tax=Laccaria bicolor (strain S238N-H82 / ATCC MYA-4686) TaxID=486041 RepID=B0DBB4_LACBS|nr:uncharacterized protein LACBIDRAFT_297494 [Laccaria bicolor S238N-H82]EDR08161.1 predicted protein [Laccaria bicolor S238N-H82]|eukprot:XP_001881231.1 predicted protein [Laccaria bicolor S238N-H82]
MFIGLMLNILLFGIMIAQVYVYHTSYKKDSWGLKCFVSYLFIADLVNAIFCFVYLYRTLIIDFGDAEALGVADWSELQCLTSKSQTYLVMPEIQYSQLVFTHSFLRPRLADERNAVIEPALTAIIASSVQLFFARRIWLLTKNWALVALVVVTSLTSGICGIMTAFEVGRTPNFVDFRNFEAVVSAWLGSTVACDAFITFILVHTLWRKHKTGFQRSDMMVDRIIRITVQTGFITMIIAALDLAFYLAVPSGLHLLFSFPLSKLYTNSLMSSLNARHKVFYGSTTQPSTMDGINTSSAMVPPSQRVHNSKQDMISFGAPARPEVFVHVEHHELRDVHEQLGIQETGNEEQSFRSSLEKGDEGKWPAV